MGSRGRFPLVTKEKHSFECFSFVTISTLLRSLLNCIHIFSISYYNLCERKGIKHVPNFGIIERIFYIKIELL